MDFPGGAGANNDMHHESGTTTPSSASASASGSGRSELSPDTSASRSLAHSQHASFDGCFPGLAPPAPVPNPSTAPHTGWAMPAPPAPAGTASGTATTDDFGSLWPFDLFQPQNGQQSFDDPLTSSYPSSAASYFAPAPITPAPPASNINATGQPWHSDNFHLPLLTTNNNTPAFPPPSANPFALALNTPLGPAEDETTLTPMFGDFMQTHAHTHSPLRLDPPAHAPSSGYTSATFPRPQVTRHVSASALSPGRRRSSTLVSAASMSPETPQSAFLPFSSYQPPYPSPRSSLSSAGSGMYRRTSVSVSAAMGPAVGAGSSQVQKRVFHPSPGMDERRYEVRTVQPLGEGEGVGSGKGQAEKKPPRFKPTKEQLEILIGTYEVNKNPDGATREKLARQLGPDVKPKTLQIWFQNRRSKSRAKERDAMFPKMALRGRASPTAPSGARVPDMDALRQMAHDDDPTLILLPLTIINIGAWYRFLGLGSAPVPDVGGALSVPSPASLASPLLHLYVVHKADTFRITVPLVGSAVANLTASDFPDIDKQAVAIRFVLSPRVVAFSRWVSPGSEQVQLGGQTTAQGPQGGWEAMDDFTEGDASTGGNCELTGPRDILVSAFSRLGPVLRLNPGPPAQSAQSGSPTTVEPDTPAAPPSAWRLPLSTSPSQSQSQSQSERSSLDFSTLQLTSSGLIDPALGAGADYHARQRSLSAPIVPGSQSAFGMFTPFALDSAQFDLPGLQANGLNGGSTLTPAADEGRPSSSMWTSGLLQAWTLPFATNPSASMSTSTSSSFAGFETGAEGVKPEHNAFASVLQPVSSAHDGGVGAEGLFGSVPMSRSLAHSSQGPVKEESMGSMGSGDDGSGGDGSQSPETRGQS